METPKNTLYINTKERLKAKNFNIDEKELKALTKRLMKATTYYLESNDIADPDQLIQESKMDFLLIKIDDVLLQKILYQKTVRIKDLLNATVYEINKELKMRHQELLSKIVATDSFSCNIYRCKRCKQRNHTMREFQSRSIDEPKSVKCNCLSCGYSWIIG